MNAIEENLARWEASLFRKLPVAGLISRNPVVYKWKSMARVWTLREATFWRVHDLMKQSYLLYQHDHVLGARILLRSGFETLATLIYLNLLMGRVLENHLDFHAFGEETSILLLGSRNFPEGPQAKNILTVLDKCDKRYPGLKKLYDGLSESAHPNYEGLLAGYSEINHEVFETDFSNRWAALYGPSHLRDMEICMMTFFLEYNEAWTILVEKLEAWVEANDKRLEETKGDAAD